jgi:nicotinamide mononucleotide (NMN) deamidase PncC
MLSVILSDAPGAVEPLHGGFMTYTKESKTRTLGAPEGLLTAKSVVCAKRPFGESRGIGKIVAEASNS